jgi:hypothetical protein
VAVRAGCDNDDRAATALDGEGRDGSSWEPSMTAFSVATSDCSAIITVRACMAARLLEKGRRHLLVCHRGKGGGHAGGGLDECGGGDAGQQLGGCEQGGGCGWWQRLGGRGQGGGWGWWWVIHGGRKIRGSGYQIGRFPNPTRELPQGVGMIEGWARWLLAQRHRRCQQKVRVQGGKGGWDTNILDLSISQLPSGSQK